MTSRCLLEALQRDFPHVAEEAAPERGWAVRQGEAVIGMRAPRRAAVAKLSGVQARAAARLRHIAELALLRDRTGEWSTHPQAFLEVVVNALGLLDGWGRWRLSAAAVLARMPRVDASALPQGTIDAAIAAATRNAQLLSNSASGSLVRLTVAELNELADRGVIIAMEPVDESAGERVRRRGERRRKLHREQMRRLRKAEREQRTNSVTGKVAKVATGCDVRTSNHRASQVVATFSLTQSGHVLAAVAAGATTIADIAAATGLPASTIKPIVSRLARAGRLRRTGHGRYAHIEEHEDE